MRHGRPVSEDPVRDRVRNLVMSHGWNSTCYQIVNPIFEYHFQADTDSVVAFVRARGRRVVAGAPVCPVELLPQVLADFESSEAGPVLYFGAGDRVVDILRTQRAAGVVSLGAQPVWQPKDWLERTTRRPSLRYQFNRARNKGVVVTEWETERAQDSRELRQVLDSWLRRRGLPPLHFLVEPETLSFLVDRRTFVAEVEGRAVAFLNLCPVPQRNGWLTEQFPRLPEAPNGTVELLMHEAACKIASEGSEYLTMGLVPFSEHGNLQDNPRWLRATEWAARRFGSSLYSFRGLDAFKSKFDPQGWEVVYAATPNRKFGLVDLLAVLEAFVGTKVSWRHFARHRSLR